MKYGCCTDMANYPVLCKTGYDFIELPGVLVAGMSEAELADTRRKLDEGAVPCSGFNAYCSGALPMVGSGANDAATREYAKLISERAAFLGAGQLGIGSPAARILPDDYPPELAWRQMSSFLSITCEEAQKKGLTVLLEALNIEMCNFMITMKDAVQMVGELKLPNLAIVLDLYHMEIMGEGESEAALAYPLVRHVHMSHRIPGGKRGYFQQDFISHYAEQFSWLKALGYDGTVSIEAGTDRFEIDAPLTLEIFRKITA